MCRLAAYLGPELYLSQLLDNQPNSLIRQSWDPKEMNEARLNADGFGFCWYNNGNIPLKYTSIMPIWSDNNLAALGQSLKSSVWLANIRSATPGQEISLANTQPFIHENIAYLHNGYLKGFNEGLRQRFHEFLTPAVQATIRGNTDSEYLFALLRQTLVECDGQLAESFKEGFEFLERVITGHEALLNIILYDGNNVIACRHALNGSTCPSLYYCHSHPDFPDAILVTSEKFSDHDCWNIVPEHSMVLINSAASIKITSI